MRPAMRTVEKRCDTSRVVRPRLSSAKWPYSSFSTRTSRLAVGSSRTSRSASRPTWRHHGPGQGHPLPLAAGQVDAAELPGQRRVPAVGQRLELVEDADPRRGLPQHRRRRRPIRGRRTRRCRAPAAGSGRSPGRSRPAGGGSRRGRARGVDAVDGDPALGGVVEAAEELDEGGLAGAVLADEGERRCRPRCRGRGGRARAGRVPG